MVLIFPKTKNIFDLPFFLSRCLMIIINILINLLYYKMINKTKKIYFFFSFLLISFVCLFSVVFCGCQNQFNIEWMKYVCFLVVAVGFQTVFEEIFFHHFKTMSVFVSKSSPLFSNGWLIFFCWKGCWIEKKVTT